MDDTAPIRPEERFDERVVASYLREHLGGLLGGGEIRFEQFPGGHANLTYLARADDVELVLRRPPLGPIAPKSHDMIREHSVLSRISDAYPLAPRAYHLCLDEAVMGSPFFVMERRKGHVIRDHWPPELPDDPQVRGRVAATFLQALIDLHLVDYPSIGLEELGHPEGFVARQVVGWTQRWEAAKTREVPAMDELARRLAGSVPSPQAGTLLHNDFKLDNVIVGPDGGLVAVFDWDMATIGDPLVDLATALAYWSEPGDPDERVFARTPLLEGGFPTRDEFAGTYAAGTGFDLSGLSWYESFAYFKVAVIVEQIFKRYAVGQTTDERFGAFGERTERLAAAGLDSTLQG